MVLWCYLQWWLISSLVSYKCPTRFHIWPPHLFHFMQSLGSLPMVSHFIYMLKIVSLLLNSIRHSGLISHLSLPNWQTVVWLRLKFCIFPQTSPHYWTSHWMKSSTQGSTLQEAYWSWPGESMDQQSFLRQWFRYVDSSDTGHKESGPSWSPTQHSSLPRPYYCWNSFTTPPMNLQSLHPSLWFYVSLLIACCDWRLFTLRICTLVILCTSHSHVSCII